jgi:hypothetical protein
MAIPPNGSGPAKSILTDPSPFGAYSDARRLPVLASFALARPLPFTRSRWGCDVTQNDTLIQT